VYKVLLDHQAYKVLQEFKVLLVLVIKGFKEFRALKGSRVLLE
jgi:hypothetical protein